MENEGCKLICRRMPNYPNVDKGNDYLISRFDGAILDALPWGSGADDTSLSSKADRPPWHTPLEATSLFVTS